ncbi:MAG: DUF748 domain-containing protein [Azoarcus sp.]|jgi:uncharacterized protein involved in outer membrane biogenesis|nr:DUF748 domain-containing protein [Azoarcus sp.]
MDSSVAADPVSASVLPLRLRRFVRLFAGIFFVLFLYVGTGFFGVPLLVKHYAPQILGDLSGRAASVEGVAFNPFTLAVELRGVRIMEGTESGHDDGSTVVALEIDRLMVNFEIASLWYGWPVVHELTLKNPRVRLVRLAEGRYNFSDVLGRFAERPQTEGDPALFSIANIRVEKGSVEMEDRITGASHRISDMKLGIPVVSRLPVKAEVLIEPDLSMLVDGHHLAAKGHLDILPDGFKGKLEQLTLKDFELSPWLGYLPFNPSFRLPSGNLDLDLRLVFSQHADEVPTVSIQGRAQVSWLAIQDRTGRPVLSAAELEVELADIQPLAGRYYFSKLRLQRPEIDLVRMRNGSFNVEGLLSAQLPADAQKQAPGTAQKARVQETALAQAEPPLDFQLSSARIRDGLIRYSDHAVEGGFSTRLEGISLDLRGLATSGQIPAEIRLDYTTASGERFSHQDRLRPRPFEYDGSLTVKGLQPALYGQYYPAFGGEVRQGRADGVFRYRVASRKEKENAGDEWLVEAGIERLDLSGFVLGLSGRKGELLKLKSLTLSGAMIQSETQQAQIKEIAAQGLALSATRFADGRFDFMVLAGRPPPTGDKTSRPWTLSLDKAAFSDSSIRFEDRAAGAQPAVMTADSVELQLDGLTTAKGAAPARLALRGRVGKGGNLALKGSFVPEPFRTDLELDLQNFALPSVQPYIAQHTQLGIRAGLLTTKGRLRLRQHQEKLEGSFAGSLTVKSFSSFEQASNQNFVHWNEFAVRQARVELEPFALAIGEVAVDGLGSRLILDENGKLNLSEIQRSPGETEDTGGSGTENTDAMENTAAAQPSWPSVNVGRIVVRNSNIAFTDRFIRPNYSAFLGNLSGELTDLSTDQEKIAKLDLQGRVGHEAPLRIKGEFNPFRQDHRLDIDAEIRDFDLPGLSGYSGRYIGYGITRGKLSANLRYQIEDNKLSAQNRVFLDQLTFGDAVDSPEATHLPVRFAVSLLKNERGEIDISLPVGGTLDDPQFSVFGLVLRALGNLIAKAITAPFALFGREELSYLDFDPGSFQIGAAQEEKLRDLAKSLESRSSLKLDITGQADARRDTEGIRRNNLRNMVMLEKRKTTGGQADGIDPESGEYAGLLGKVYEQAKIRKPRNFIGLTKNLPVGEMEKLLLESIDIKQEDVDSLATRREAAVQRWLTDQGGIPPERLFRRAMTDGEARENGREGNGVRFSLR